MPKLKMKPIVKEAVYCEKCNDKLIKEDGNIYYPDYGDGPLCLQCYSEDYIHCNSCSTETWRDNSYFSEREEERYCDYCYNEIFAYCEVCEFELYIDNEAIYDDRSGTYACEDCYSGDQDSDTFVTESPRNVECTHNDSDTFSAMNVHRLVGIEAEAILDEVYEDREPMENIPLGWRPVFDGSITGEGREMVSIPANGDILNGRIENLCDWASFHNVTVNKSCGLHLHIDATDTDWRDLRSIAIVAKRFEKYIYSMLPRSRMKVSWCRKLPMSISELKSCNDEGDFVNLWYDSCGSRIDRDKYNDSRYHGLNLHARFYLGTVEFRYHSGTLNKKKITNWVKICNSIFETGIKLSRDKNWKHSEYFVSSNDTTLIGLVSKMVGFDNDMLKYFLDRTMKFSNSGKLRSGCFGWIKEEGFFGSI